MYMRWTIPPFLHGSHYQVAFPCPGPRICLDALRSRPPRRETALAVEHVVEHVLRKKRSGTAAPCTFHESYFYTFSRCQIRISWSNWGFTVPSLRVLQELGTAPLEIFHIPSTPPMIASFMAQIMFTGEFRVTWGTVCHQDAFATIFMCREHTCQSTSGTNTRRALRRRLSRLGSCSHSQIINLDFSSGVFIIGALV